MITVTFSDDTILHIEDSALFKLYSYKQNQANQNEAGGVLFGKKIANTEEYIVSDISEPSKKDKQSRFSFVRDYRNTQKDINKKWKESEGIVNYIGEWHTHPECNPFPSSTDKNLVRQLIDDNSNVFNKLFLVIVGMDESLYIGLADTDISNNVILSIQMRSMK